MLTIIVPLMLAAAAPSATDRSAIEGRFVEIYKPYAAGSGGTPSLSQPIYSAELTALIAQWQGLAPAGETELPGDRDWLCQCRQWDGDAFTANIVAIGMAGDDVAELDASVDLGIGAGPESTRTARLILKREEGAWMVDDILAVSLPNGLKEALREAIGARGGERG